MLIAGLVCVEPHGGGAVWGLLGFLWFWILHMLVGSREGSPRTAESSSLPRLVISPTVCSRMINEQVLMCGSDSPVARGQADIYRGAQTAGRQSKKQPHLRESVRAFWDLCGYIGGPLWQEKLWEQLILFLKGQLCIHPAAPNRYNTASFFTAYNKLITLALVIYVWFVFQPVPGSLFLFFMSLFQQKNTSRNVSIHFVFQKQATLMINCKNWLNTNLQSKHSVILHLNLSLYFFIVSKESGWSLALLLLSIFSTCFFVHFYE